jgi:RNA polymerase sigma-70 factor (ECF subfamily)
MIREAPPSLFSDGSGRFCTTQWTVVLQAGAPGPQRAEALDQFCRAYWYPLYAFLRRRGESAEDAGDLVQQFFAQVLERGWLGDVERRETRFSTLLLTIFQRFLVSEHRRAAAEKRGGGRVPISIDLPQAEEWYGAEPACAETPEKIFARRWALAVLDAAHATLRARAEVAGKAQTFALLGPFLAREPQPGEYDALEPLLALRPGAIAVAVHRLRQQFRDVLREELGAGRIAAAEVDEEMRHLVAALS